MASSNRAILNWHVSSCASQSILVIRTDPPNDTAELTLEALFYSGEINAKLTTQPGQIVDEGPSQASRTFPKNSRCMTTPSYRPVVCANASEPRTRTTPCIAACEIKPGRAKRNPDPCRDRVGASTTRSRRRRLRGALAALRCRAPTRKGDHHDLAVAPASTAMASATIRSATHPFGSPASSSAQPSSTRWWRELVRTEASVVRSQPIISCNRFEQA